MSGHDFPEIAAEGDLSDRLDHIAMILERISKQLMTIEGIQLEIPDNRDELRRLIEEVQGLRKDLRERRD
jgi:hypothetical protein